MQYRSTPLALAAALLLTTSFALAAADPSKPAAKPAASQPATTAAPAGTAKASPTKATTKPAKKPKPVDINSASAEQLKTVPGVDDGQAAKIIQNRPYPTRAYLVTKGVLDQDDYYKVKDYFVAAPPPPTKATAKK